MESYVIDTAGLAALIKDESLLLVDCSRRESSSVTSIPNSKFIQLSWNSSRLAEEFGNLRLYNYRQIVAFDSKGIELAARLWWLLRKVGCETVRILDGGLEKWVDEYGSVCDCEVDPVETTPAYNVSGLSKEIVTRSELLETDPESFFLLQTNTFPGLEDKVLTSNGELRPISELEEVLKTCRMIPDESKQMIVGGELAGTMLLIFTALGYSNCRVLNDEGAQLITKRTTVFYDVDESEWIQNEVSTPENQITTEAAGYLGSAPSDASDEFNTRNTRFFTVQTFDSEPPKSVTPAWPQSPNVSAPKAPSEKKRHYEQLPEFTRKSTTQSKKEAERQNQCSACLIY